MTYYVNAITDNRNTEVQFLRAAHVGNGDPSLNEIVRDSYNFHFKCPFGFTLHSQSLKDDVRPSFTFKDKNVNIA